MEGSIHGVILRYVPGICLEGLQKALKYFTLVKCSRKDSNWASLRLKSKSLLAWLWNRVND
jgi:hypothetical protein